jgi:hypothetical protein
MQTVIRYLVYEVISIKFALNFSRTLKIPIMCMA